MKAQTSIMAVVLAGGQSRRMGQDKASLTIGGLSFLEKIAGELAGFGEVLVSVADAGAPRLSGCRNVVDVYKGCGPLSGLYSALSVIETEALLAVSCDLPFFNRALGEYLVAQLDADADAVVPVTAGRIHPLCAVYRKRCAGVFKQQLEQGDLKLRNALMRLRTKYVEITDGDFAEMLDKNINTRADLETLGAKDHKS